MLPSLLVLPLLYLRGLQAGPAEHGLISKLLEQVQEEGVLFFPLNTQDYQFLQNI